MGLLTVSGGRHSVRLFKQMGLRVRMVCVVLLLASMAGCARTTATAFAVSPTLQPPTVAMESPGATGSVSGPSDTSTLPPESDIVHLGAAWTDFSLRFDPGQWRGMPFSSDLAGLEMLMHRSIPGCQVTPNVPVGFELQKDWTMEDGQSTLGGTTFTTRRFFQQGKLTFVAYYGFLGNLHDGSAEVHFEGDSTACLDAAEQLFANADVIRPAPTP